MDLSSIYCISCGGYIADVRRAGYRVWSDRTQVAAPRDEPCACGEPVLWIPRARRPPARRTSAAAER